MAAELSPVEKVKASSRLLRGTLADSLKEPVSGGLPESDATLIKFHGTYLQDDRDQREERRIAKLEPAHSFMIRTRLPGGVCAPSQWLALSALARRHANGSLRVTTRQAFQFHGVLKQDLKTTIASINATLIDTIAACGDVNRNVLCSPNPVESRAHADAHAWAIRLSEHLLPHTRAYHEIWLDAEKVAGTEEVEPLYGPTYLPRKFKAALVVPPYNDVDVFAQDLGFIAIVERGAIAGFNVTVGGGLGTTHGETATGPRLADLIGFVAPDRLLAVAEAVLTTQRDHGDRANRKHAKLKYTIADRGIDWFKAEVERRAGFALEPARDFRFERQGDRFGWIEGHDGRWHLNLRIESGRVAGRALDGLDRIARDHEGDFRLTPNQNLVVANVPAERKARIDELAAKYGLDRWRTATPLRLDALACVALPTCPLAMAEAERYLPWLLDAVHARLARHGLEREPLTLRITGCPNGCARPYLAEIGLVGKAPGRYNLLLGGDAAGRRLNVLFLENADEATILDALDAQFAAYTRTREPQERFGDFLWRAGVLAGRNSVHPRRAGDAA
jgi:sulfite reductase (NADPH) hemoprotein beta-component